MQIIGNRLYVEVPGDKMHELPPLLVRSSPTVKRLDRMMELATGIVEEEHLIREGAVPESGPEDVDRRRYDLALNLAEEYLKLLGHWRWGDSILEWIRQCETTFESQAALRSLLRPDLWPHASRSSFVALLADKAVRTDGVELEKAVGLRLTFRLPPPILCFSDQFLFYLNASVADTAYQSWARLSADLPVFLPPERFCFQVVNLAD